MQLDMSAQEVIHQIRQLDDQGETLTKRKVKETHPGLLRNALYYFPSWDHALRESGLER